ncbi:MAG TPA: hypothetical protein P5181_07290 [Dermatophilaceae bacterium]|nr:hypothetical protein [Dermatophilaceae bacterium]
MPNQTHLTDLASVQRPTLPVSERIARIILALFYGSAVMVAAEPLLRDAVATATDSPFSSPTTMLVALRVSTAVWAVLFALLQAWIYGLVWGAVTRVPRPQLGRGWTYVLVGQVPFMLLVGWTYLHGGVTGPTALQSPLPRHALGLVSVAIYGLLAHRAAPTTRGRLAAYLVLMSAANAALMLLSPGR